MAEYNQFLKENGLYKENAPVVLITGFMGSADELEKPFEEKSFVVYRVNQLKAFVAKHYADSVDVSAVVNREHGDHHQGGREDQ